MLKQNKSSLGIQARVGKILAFIPLRPNHWTMFALFLAAMGAFAIALLHDLFLGLLFFMVGGALDMVDGAVARARNEATKFGAFLDGVSDRFMEALFLFLIYLSLYLSTPYKVNQSIRDFPIQIFS